MDIKRIFRRHRPKLRPISAAVPRKNPPVSTLTDVGSKLKSRWQSEIGANSSDSSDEEVPGPPPQKRYRKSTSFIGEQMTESPMKQSEDDEDVLNTARYLEDEGQTSTSNTEVDICVSNTQMSTSGCSRKRNYSQITTKYRRTKEASTQTSNTKLFRKKKSNIDVCVPAINDITYCLSPVKQSVVTKKNSVVNINDVTLIENQKPSVTGCTFGQRKRSRGSLFPTLSGAGANRRKDKQPSRTVTKTTRPRHAKQRAPSSSSGEDSPPRATVANTVLASPAHWANIFATPSSASDSLFGSRNMLYDSLVIDSSDSEAPHTQQTNPSLNLPPAITFAGTSSTVDPESTKGVRLARRP